jgi:hypothetical protein
VVEVLPKGALVHSEIGGGFREREWVRGADGWVLGCLTVGNSEAV